MSERLEMGQTLPPLNLLQPETAGHVVGTTVTALVDTLLDAGGDIETLSVSIVADTTEIAVFGVEEPVRVYVTHTAHASMIVNG